MMQILYYLKKPLIIFLAGSIIRIIGAMMKILHWRLNELTLITGTVIMVLGLLFLIIKIKSIKKDSQLP